MLAIQISEPFGPFETVQRSIPEPSSGQILLKVIATSLCQGDKVIKDREFPFLTYPRVPGHEVVGTVFSVGPDVPSTYKVGSRFGVGWHGGSCGKCQMCQVGHVNMCEKGYMTGITIDGGLAEYALVRYEALVKIPEDLSSAEAAPLLCAGLTTYRALASLELSPGSWIGIQGIGGLGCLGIQYAKKMGFKPLAISTSSSKKDYCLELGADAFLDVTSEDPIEFVKTVTHGLGLNVLLATAPSNEALKPLLPTMAFEGVVMVLAALHGPLIIDSSLLMMKNMRIQGFISGSSTHNQVCMDYSHAHNVKPLIETFTPHQVNEAYEKMMSGKVRFRAVIVFQPDAK